MGYFELGHQKLSDAGYVQYEISGYSKPGYQCQHNLNYWRFGDYLGIGCGAHGKLSFADGRIVRTTKTKHPRGYLAALNNLAKLIWIASSWLPIKTSRLSFYEPLSLD